MDSPAELLDDIRALKTRAKNRRDGKEFHGALELLARAADLAEQGRADAWDDEAAPFVAELADIHGMMGGVTRREGLEAPGTANRHDLLMQSIGHYDRGFAYETSVRGEATSYNLVNRIVGRILVDPASLDADPDAEPSSVPAMLRAAHDSVLTQLELRRDDPWMLADRALLEILMSESTSARRAYGPLLRTAPPAYVYTSVLDTLEPLADIAGDRRPALRDAVEDLRRDHDRLAAQPKP